MDFVEVIDQSGKMVFKGFTPMAGEGFGFIVQLESGERVHISVDVDGVAASFRKGEQIKYGGIDWEEIAWEPAPRQKKENIRELVEGEKVRVYRNLRAGRKSKKKIYSVVGSDGRVIAHVEKIMLRDAKFIVRPAGREKVRRTGVKNVHAFVVGKYYRRGLGRDPSLDFHINVVYDPKVDEGFMVSDRRHQIHGAAYVAINQNGISAAYIQLEKGSLDAAVTG